MTELVTANGNALAVVEQATQALSRIETAEEADRFFRDVRSAEEWARRHQELHQAVLPLRRLQLRAKRRYGELLGEAKPGAPVGNKSALKNNVAESHVVSQADRDVRKKARKLAEVPEEVFEKVLAAESVEKITEAAILRTLRHEKAAEKKDTKRALSVPTSDWSVHLSTIADFDPGEPLDAIVTDPPYPQEYLETWWHLGEFAVKYLKPGGSLVAMSGQSYLPEIYRALDSVDGLVYRWTLAYLTPGAGTVQLFDRNVNTFWKPILWFTKGDDHGDWYGDVIQSESRDKFFHKWGQSVSGTAELIDRASVPGDLVCDPFLGGGTTGVVATGMGRRFVGCDNDPVAIATSEERMAA